MSVISDFTTMTKRERRGMIAVMVLIALLLACTAGLRYCVHDVDYQVQNDEIQQFEESIDTTTMIVTGSGKKPKHGHSKRKRQARKPAKPKPAPSPRRIDPVPQF